METMFQKYCKKDENDEDCNHYECANADSLTVLINEVVEKHALKVSDINALRPGETIKVILFDRNIGDYLHGMKAGTVIRTKDYIHENHLAEYTHSVTGKLYMHSIGETFNNWTWEVNLAYKDPNYYWGPADALTRVGPLGGKNNESVKRLSEVPGEVKVGWRGPAILYKNLADMPESFVHYDRCCDDYFVVKTRNLTDIPTTNCLTERSN